MIVIQPTFHQTRLADSAKAAGVDVQLAIWKDMIYVFAAYACLAPEGQQAIDQIGDFIQGLFT